MQPAPQREGKILADWHAHPGNYFRREKTLEMLTSPGLVGLTHINGERRILTYEEALTLPGVYPGIKEIDLGMLAEINLDGRKGYIMRAQEVVGGFAHLLALGFEGDYFPEYKTPQEAVEGIHQRKGLAILSHPYVTPNHQALIVKYRLINEIEEKTLWELCRMVDEIETFNAQAINPTYGLIVPDMKEANEKAAELAKGGGFKGMACSDAHFRLEQVKLCGIYLDEKDLCMDRIKEDLKKGNFERYGDTKEGPYVSKWSFVRGMFKV